MSPIEIPYEELSRPSNWKPGGQSPAMNPTAVIQFTEMLLGLLANPEILMVSGIQIPELFAELIRSGPLKNNAKKIQISRDEIQARLGGGAGVPGGVVGPPGGAGPQVAPSAPIGAGTGEPPLQTPAG